MNILQNVLPKLNFSKDSSLDRVHKIPICRILPNPAQPRKYFDSNETLRLADSIRLHGILQPLCVRKPVSEGDVEDFNGIYELISGERRLRAAKLLGLPDVPCIIIEADSLKSAELAIIENLQREDLNIFEEANALSALINLYGLTQEEVAAKISASQSYVANKLRLLRFDEFEQKLIIEKHLTERHARALLRIADVRMRRAALGTIIERGYNVADTEEFVAKLIKETSPDKPEKKPRTALVKDIRLFYNTLDRAVDIMLRAGINAKTQKRDLGDMYEITVRIPKCNED
ncbi:MAG: ParB/RepB/Spo0J family partition protein [Clostridia bacterium]|nr:ParB/RepB/Spo0J family partition protein [Clostridia bacterium]